ncbi:MAG TPA: hypothetical protein VFI47_08690 [Acidimicrobiales bacterium]|nr:hypothetical protein [Acidimicrobiales bacterium]
MTAPGDPAELATALVRDLGGRFSTELGIDVGAGDAETERWFLAATLFGTRISTGIAERAFHVLEAAGITRIDQVSHRTWAELVELLDAAGYTRYDFRTATRLQALAAVVRERWVGKVSEMGRRLTDPADLAAALDDLPGWGPVTVGLFLRELRGVWPGARPSLDERAADAARHIGMLDRTDDAIERLGAIATRADLDARDLEAALVRLALRHRRLTDCPGGRSCIALDPPRTERHRLG